MELKQDSTNGQVDGLDHADLWHRLWENPKDFTTQEQLLFAYAPFARKVLARLIFGIDHPEGKLPFELPSSWEAVQNQKEDVPYDSEAPLYEFGHGLRYPEPGMNDESGAK